MENKFSPLIVCVTGETKESGFLPDGNFIKINGMNYPLGHCFTLEMPVGSCQLEVHTPPPNTIHRVSTTIKELALYRMILTVDTKRNIIDAAFEIDENASWLYENECKHAAEHRAKIAQWRANQRPAAAPAQSPRSTSPKPTRKGNKLIGWGLTLLIFFGIGVLGCCTGSIAVTTFTSDGIAVPNLAVYIGGAAIGLIMFIAGLLRRNTRA